jgi:Zn-dependent protease
MFGPDFWQRLAIGLPVLLLSLTVHEFFHAWTAKRFGDDTAERMGRLTLNPIAHIDLIGLIVMIASQFRFGWAKPVPVNPMNLRNPRVADIWISAAGPLSNFGLAIIAGTIFRLLHASMSGMQSLPEAIPTMLTYAVWINVSLAFFNLIPLFPLDGSHILRNLLPREYEASMDRFDSIAPFVLLGLVVFGMVWMIIGPAVAFFAPLFLGA